MADGTMPVMAATSMTVVTAASETEECSGGGRGHGKVSTDESGVRGLPENDGDSGNIDDCGDGYK